VFNSEELVSGVFCCQVVIQWWVIFWWMKAERSDLEGKNLGLIRGRSGVFRASTVSLPCIIPLWLGIQIKTMSCAGGSVKLGYVRL